MTIIAQTFLQIKPKCALIPFIIAGAPNLNTTFNAIKILDNIGADIIEVGLPYSDPLADGPIIQEASAEALKKGIEIEDIFNMFRELKNSIKSPIILFAYYNLILSYGIKHFIYKLKDIGIKGLLVPDLPIEESDLLFYYTSQANIEIILLVAPTSSNRRIKMISQKSQGFIYLVTSRGVTGIRSGFKNNIYDLVQSIKQITTKPIAVGFGISSADHVAQMMSWGVDGVIIGSACVQILSDPKKTEAQTLCNLSYFIREIKLVTGLEPATN
nr:tryptophan synthase alpha subunit [Cavernulicola chilensis]